MGRHRAQAGRGGCARWVVRIVAAIAFAGLGAAAMRCRPDRWLEGLGGGDGAPRPAPTPSRRTASPKPTASSPRAPAASVHLELGTPVRTGKAKADPGDERLMIKPQYALAYSRSRSAATWVSWELDASWFGDAPRHRGKFIADDALPDGWRRVTHDDYTGSGFDRGHMVRSEERTRSPEDNKATFLLTNVLPQRHDLNAGPWLRLEEYCQELAQKEKRRLFIAAGGIFGSRPRTAGKDVAVPDSFFKIIVVLGRGQGAGDVSESTRVIAVMMPNTTGIIDEGWGRYRTTVDDVEERAGYDFLSAVPEEAQRVIESRTDDEAGGGR